MKKYLVAVSGLLVGYGLYLFHPGAAFIFGGLWFFLCYGFHALLVVVKNTLQEIIDALDKDGKES